MVTHKRFFAALRMTGGVRFKMTLRHHHFFYLLSSFFSDIVLLYNSKIM
jgi:hypothetical protein